MSRRFKNRHAKVKADPHAEPTKPIVLDDSNSFVDVLQPDRRIPKQLNTRDYIRAESAASDEAEDDTIRAESAASDEAEDDTADSAAG